MKTLQLNGFLLILVYLIISVSNADAIPATPCSPAVPVDIVFAVDTTSTSTDESYKKSIQLVVSIVNDLTIGQNAAQVGLVLGDTDAWPQSGLSDDKNLILNRLTNTTLPPSPFEILIPAINKLYDSSDARRHAKRILIFVTDSPFEHFYNKEFWAEVARDNLITIFALGVKPGADDSHLNLIVPKPEYNLPGDDFSALTSFICHETPYVPDTPTDIMIVIDQSQNADIFNRYIQFAEKIIQNVTISEKGTHVGLYICSSNYVNPMFLTGDKNSTYRDLRRRSYKKQDYDIDTSYFSSPLFNLERGARLYAKRIVLLLADTDREDFDSKLYEEAVQQLKVWGVTIFTLGIQPGPSRIKLNAVASKPEYNLPPDDISALNEFISNVSKVKAT